MRIVDQQYLRLQFRNKVYQKNATEFQNFFEDIMQHAYKDFQKTRSYGKRGDCANDGYRPDVGEYYQAYAPQDPQEKEAEAARKLKRDFEVLNVAWDQISKIRTFFFVFNDKYKGVSIEIEEALAELKGANPQISFKKLFPKDLEDIFFTLSPDQMLELGFDIDSTNALRIARESLVKLEIDLDRDNGIFVLRALENLKEIIANLSNENLVLEYEILECRALQRLERVKEAIQGYESLCKRYPSDPRAFLYLAEIQLNNEDFEKNSELMKEAERIDSRHWLLLFEKLTREDRLENRIDVSEIDENTFPSDPRIKSTFYRLYAAFLHRAGVQARAESFIQRAIHLNPNRVTNYLVRLAILEDRLFSDINDKEKLLKGSADLLYDIDGLEKMANEWGGLSARNQATLDFLKIRLFVALENASEIERLEKESFELIMQCYFDHFIDNLLAGLLTFVVLPLGELNRLLRYLKSAEKGISDGLASMIVIQFNFKQTLLTDGKKFFGVTRKKGILNLIDNLEKKEYQAAWVFLKEDLKFAVAMANTAKQFPDLRKTIIENLPDDGNIQKEKLLLLLNYDEKHLEEAFTIIKGLDLSNLHYFECKPILEIAQEKKAWEFVIKIVEKLLGHEKEKRVLSQLKLLLFSANFNLKRFPQAIEIGEEILSDSEEMTFLDDHNKEVLLANTLLVRMKRGEYKEAKALLEKHSTLSRTFQFKVEIEAEVYIKNNDAYKALESVVTGVKIRKTPTPEEYGKLYILFVEIENLIDFRLDSQENVEIGSFIKFKDQERWYFIGDKDELDATKVSQVDEKYSKLIGKKIGEKVTFEDKYRSAVIEHIVENILPIEKYILWRCMHHVQQLSLEHRWNVMEMIEVPKKGEGIDTKFIIARLEDEKKKRGGFFEFYCRENIPLAFLAASEGGLTNAIALITNEKKGFVKFSSGDLGEMNQQKEVAKRIIAGESFYIDGTSALVLSEPGLLEKVYEFLPNLKVPQSVITLLLETKGRFRYVPGHVGHMGYAQGKLTFSSVDPDKSAIIDKNFEASIKLLESRPQNISAISAANKADSFSEKQAPPELCDACVLAQKDNLPVLTEDFLYLKVNELDTKKKAPEYCSAFALTRVLYEQKKITFEQYLSFFAYLSSYRFRFLHLTIEDIEKAVFGDRIITIVQPERIRWLNFPLTLSEEYGVPFAKAFGVVVGFLTGVLIDDTILPVIVERIFVEIISAFPTEKDKKTLGKMFLKFSAEKIKRIRRNVIIGSAVQQKIGLLSEIADVYSSENNLWIPQ